MSREEQLSWPAASSRAPQLGILATLQRNTYHALGLRTAPIILLVFCYSRMRLSISDLLSSSANVYIFDLCSSSRTRTLHVATTIIRGLANAAQAFSGTAPRHIDVRRVFLRLTQLHIHMLQGYITSTCSFFLPIHIVCLSRRLGSFFFYLVRFFCL